MSEEYCEECDMNFCLFDIHCATAHQNKTLSFCQLCGISFLKEKHLKKHLSIHSSNISCHICSESHDDSKNLLKHLETHLNLHVYSCKECKKTFATEYYHDKHLRKKHGKRKIQLVDADNDESTVVMREKSNSTPHENQTDFNIACMSQNNVTNDSESAPMSDVDSSYCSICNFSFCSINLHILLVHSHKSQYICEYCGIIICKEKYFKRHINEHNSDEIKCHICLSDFDKSKQLFQHLESHKELHVFKCSHCAQSYVCAKHYERHLRRKHCLDISANSTVVKDSIIDSPVKVKSEMRGSSLSGDENKSKLRSMYSPTKTISEKLNLSGSPLKKNKCIDRSLNAPLSYKKPILRSQNKSSNSQTNEVLSDDARKNNILDHVEESDSDHFYNTLMEQAKNKSSRNKTRDYSLTETQSWYAMFKEYGDDFKCNIDPEVDYTCFKCKSMFSNHNDLFYHYFEDHNKSEMSCTICSRTFADQSYKHLYWHYLKHSKAYPWSCHSCSRSFKSKFFLFKHVKSVHEKVSMFKCEYCEKEFIYLTHFKLHIKSHIKDFFICEHCNKKFVNKYYYTNHLKSKDCKVCKIKLFCRSQFENHFKTKHMNQKVFKCDHCDLAFNLERYKIRHMTIEHFKACNYEKKLCCKFCDYITHTNKSLNRHYRINHSDSTNIMIV